MYKITIEDLETKSKNEFVFENVNLNMQRGIEWGKDELHPNGHLRTLIKAWSGCADFDDFQTI